MDIPPAFRNDVLRSKQVIIGCGGGFHQECQQPYSPVATWMEDADVALNDEGQQYGNLDEASAVARTPRKCLVIWCGHHKQTPGGLRKTDEAKAFRRKLLRRPIALRGNTEHFQPNMLGKVVLRYLEGPGQYWEDFFFLCCRIAHDSCGQVIARSQKEIEIQLTYGKQQETKPNQHQQTEARVS